MQKKRLFRVDGGRKIVDEIERDWEKREDGRNGRDIESVSVSVTRDIDSAFIALFSRLSPFSNKIFYLISNAIIYIASSYSVIVCHYSFLRFLLQMFSNALFRRHLLLVFIVLSNANGVAAQGKLRLALDHVPK